MRKVMTLSAFALAALSVAQSPLWTQVDGAPAMRLKDGSQGLVVRWDLGSTTVRLNNLSTQLSNKSFPNNAIGIHDVLPDGSKMAFSRVEDNGDGSQTYYVDVVRPDKSLVLSVPTFRASPERPSYGPERVFFSPDGNYLVLQYYSDENGEAFPQAVYYNLGGGGAQTVVGRLLPYASGGYGLVTNQDGSFSQVHLATAGLTETPYPVPEGFFPKETRGDWILGLGQWGGWMAVRRTDGFVRQLTVGNDETMLGLAEGDRMAVIHNPSTGKLRGMTLNEGYHLELPSGNPGPATLSPDRLRIVQPLVPFRKKIVRLSNRNDVVYTDERNWLAGFDASNRVWMLGSEEWRVRDDTGGIPERYYVPNRPGAVVWTNGIQAVDRVMEGGQEVFYKVDFFKQKRSKWFEVTPKYGAWWRFDGHKSASRHYLESNVFKVDTFDNSGVAYQPTFPNAPDYLTVQGFAPDGKLYGVTTTSTDPNLPGPTDLVFYQVKTGAVAKKISIGNARSIAQTVISSSGNLAAVTTQTDLRLVDLITKTARPLSGNAAKSWQKSVNDGAGQPMVALSGNGAVLFLGSTTVSGFYRVSDGKMLAKGPLNANTAEISADGTRGLITVAGTKMLFAIPTGP